MKAKRIAIADLSAEERSRLAWALTFEKVSHGEDLRTALLWGIRNGVILPDEHEDRTWIADALDGKLTPKRSRGRPAKRERWNLVRAIVEKGILKSYEGWLAGFQRDREKAWLRAEGLRLKEKHPLAATWRRTHGLGDEESRRAWEADLNELGARPCPPSRRGGVTPSELALKATALECKAGWLGATGLALTAEVVRKVLTRARRRA